MPTTVMNHNVNCCVLLWSWETPVKGFGPQEVTTRGLRTTDLASAPPPPPMWRKKNMFGEKMFLPEAFNLSRLQPEGAIL